MSPPLPSPRAPRLLPWTALLACLLLSSPLAGQHRHAPYAGQASREIKALSPEEVRGLRQGDGMGMAKSAELNGVPGPRHVLELEDRLQLTVEQQRRVREVHRAMQEEAVRLGREIVRRERAMDRRFASGEITAEEVDAATAAVAELRGRLRAVHLKAHLATEPVLTDAQIERYRRLRGYAGSREEGR